MILTQDNTSYMSNQSGRHSRCSVCHPSFSIHSHKSEPLYLLVGEMLCVFLYFPSAPVSDQVGLSQVFSRCFMSSYQSAGALGPFNCPKRILTTHSRNCPSPRSFR